MEGNIISAIVEEWEPLGLTKPKQREAVSMKMEKNPLLLPRVEVGVAYM
jgi:hypothetical protein